MSLAASEPAIFSCLCLHIQDVLSDAYTACPSLADPHLTAHWVPLSQLEAMLRKGSGRLAQPLLGTRSLVLPGLRLGCGGHKAEQVCYFSAVLLQVPKQFLATDCLAFQLT